MQHVMIDLETMSTEPNGAIVSLGAVHFDRDTEHASFYTPIGLKDCLGLGLHQSTSTMSWWAAQKPEARAAWEVENPPTLLEALTDFTKWLLTFSTPVTLAVWGNGAGFDPVLVESAYKAVNADAPWRFYNVHCFRTMKNLFPVAKAERTGTYHHALDDARTQAKQLQQICKTYDIRL